jgi:ubiquitin-activating enzyme E1
MEIDTNLYSRQIGTYGLEAMEKILKLKVFICGVRGVKNII